MSCIILRGSLVLNVHATPDDKTDDVKDSFCEELECVFVRFHKYEMKIVLDFNSKVSMEDVSKPSIANEC
jgi:hypothetical protein